MTKDEFIAWEIGDGAVRLHGAEYVLVKSSGETDGAVATREAFENFEISFAHAYVDGPIKRFHEIIGDISEIESVSDEGH